MANLVVYGATGYSGRLIVEHAASRGLKPIIAGRDRNGMMSMAAAYDLDWRVAGIDDPEALRSVTASGSVLLNAARPFAATSAALIDACIATGTHYLDITGQPDVIEAAATWHDRAIGCGVMVMPAAGFEVVASDCLAGHVTRRLPGAIALKFGLDVSQPSRGSMKTGIEMNGRGVLIRRDAKLVTVAPGSLVHHFDYGRGPQISLAVSLGDVSSAHFSTGVPNIETYMCATLPLWYVVTANQYWGPLLSTSWCQALLSAQVDWFAPNPSRDTTAAGWGGLVAEPSDAIGQRVCSRVRTGDVYRFTALSAVGVAEKCFAGEFKPGFQTPCQVYGPDFVLSFGEALREDI
jgi:short subunit dehydrogenase-like uncharacterized protein